MSRCSACFLACEQLQDVFPLDRVLKVNGETSSSAGLARLMATNDCVELLIQRPKRREVTVDSEALEFLDSETYGLVVSANSKGLEPLERVIAVEGEEGSAPVPWSFGLPGIGLSPLLSP